MVAADSNLDPPPAEVLEFLPASGIPPAALATTGLQLLADFRRDLSAANRQVNLTRITSPDDFWIKHIADSLAICRIAPELVDQPRVFADIGCGAGFPLIPLLWLNPNLNGCGIEARRRKADFVKQQLQRLHLTNGWIVAQQLREAARQPTLNGKFDLVIARAVGKVWILFKDCQRLLRPDSGNSRIILYKTPKTIAEEMHLIEREAAKLNLKVDLTDIIDLPCGGGQRQFVVVQ
jgi:16S rRNA (guanine527-N7)-methyltransferase